MSAGTRWKGLTVVVAAGGAVAVLATGALGASVIAGLTGTASVAGTSGPATGATIQTYTVGDGTTADRTRTVVAADGTFSVSFPRTGTYHVELLGDNNYKPTETTVDSVPGATIECAVTAAHQLTDHESAFECDQDARSAFVYRFWSPVFDNAHFFTTNEDEAAHIAQHDTNWVYEGVAFHGVEADGETCTVGTPVFRFYSPVYRSHFFTHSTAEKSHIVANDRSWSYEGVAYCAYAEPVAGSQPLHRFWSPVFGKHFFTATQSEADHIRATDRNWEYEGVAYHVLP